MLPSSTIAFDLLNSIELVEDYLSPLKSWRIQLGRVVGLGNDWKVS